MTAPEEPKPQAALEMRHYDSLPRELRDFLKETPITACYVTQLLQIPGMTEEKALELLKNAITEKP